MEQNQAIDLQGHRGCRGLMPENTIEGFKKTLDIGVTTLEMDLVISADLQVVVSHEPFFSHEIAKDSLGNDISEEEEIDHNIFLMTYDQIMMYDVGSKPHMRFPEQKKIKAKKPLLRDVFEISETYTKEKDIKEPLYNIEIKRRPEWDSLFHPEVRMFTELVVQEVQRSGFKERITIQSFDIEALQKTREHDPEIRLVLLVENNLSPEENIELLGFVPEVYSPEFHLVNEALMNYCDKHGMLLIPWTVNNEKDMEILLDMGVDGIITDYPDRLSALLMKKGIGIL